MRKRTAGSFPFVFFCAVAFCPPLWYGEAEENTEKGRDILGKQRLFKMGMLEKNFLVKALCDAQNHPDRKPPARCRALSIKPSMRQRESCT